MVTFNFLLLLSTLLEGFSWGAGFSLAVALCLVWVPNRFKRAPK